MKMEDLPTEILWIISDYLPSSDKRNLRLVCRKFAELPFLSSSKYHVRKLQDLVDYDLTTKEIVLSLLWGDAERWERGDGPKLETTHWRNNVGLISTLHLRVENRGLDKIFGSIFSLLKDLEVIVIIVERDNNISPDKISSLVDLMGELPKLKELTYDNFEGRQLHAFIGKVLHKWGHQLQTFLINAPNCWETKLDIETIGKIGPQFVATNVLKMEFENLEALLKKLPNFRKLAIATCLPHWDFLVNLTHLELSGSQSNASWGTIKLPQMPNLQALDIANLNACVLLAAPTQKLKILHCRKRNYYPNNTLLRQIKSLQVMMHKDEMNFELVKKCLPMMRNLRILEISFERDIMNETVIHALNSMSALLQFILNSSARLIHKLRLPLLEDLFLGSPDFFRPPTPELMHLRDNCPQLRKVFYYDFYFDEFAREELRLLNSREGPHPIPFHMVQFEDDNCYYQPCSIFEDRQKVVFPSSFDYDEEDGWMDGLGGWSEEEELEEDGDAGKASEDGEDGQRGWSEEEEELEEDGDAGKASEDGEDGQRGWSEEEEELEEDSDAGNDSEDG